MTSENPPSSPVDIWIANPTPIPEGVVRRIREMQQQSGYIDPSLDPSKMLVDFDAEGFGRATSTDFRGSLNEYYWIVPDNFVNEPMPSSDGKYTFGDLMGKAVSTEESIADSALEGQTYPALKTFLLGSSGDFGIRINHVNNFQYRLNPDCNDTQGHEAAVGLVTKLLDDPLLAAAYGRLKEVYAHIKAGTNLQRYVVEREIIVSALFNDLDPADRKGLSR